MRNRAQSRDAGAATGGADMSSQTVAAQAHWRAGLQPLVESRIAAGERALFERCLSAYFETASPDALAQRSPEELFAIAQAHWRFAQQRRHDEAGLRIQMPERGRYSRQE